MSSSKFGLAQFSNLALAPPVPVDPASLSLGGAAHLHGLTAGHAAAAGLHAGAHAAAAAASTALAAVGIAAGAVIITYAAARGAESAVEGMARLKERLDSGRERLVDFREAEDLWRQMAGQVTRRNARIAALAAVLPDGPPDPPLPSPMGITDASLGELLRRCEAVDRALEAAERAYAARRRDATLEHLAGRLPRTLVTAAEELTAEAAHAEHAAPVANAEPGLRDRLVAAEGGLDPAVTADEHGRVLHGVVKALDAVARAERLAGTADGAAAMGTARSWASEVETLVRRANQAASDARRADEYLQAIEGGFGPEGPSGDAARVRESLRQVLARQRSLDRDLEARAEAAVEAARAAAQRGYVLALVREALTAMDFEVADEEFGSIRFQHPDWRQHSVTLGIDEEMRMSARLKATGAASADDRRQSLTDWMRRCPDLENLLSGNGIRIEFVPTGDEVDEPEPVPVVKPKARERER